MPDCTYVWAERKPAPKTTASTDLQWKAAMTLLENTRWDLESAVGLLWSEVHPGKELRHNTRKPGGSPSHAGQASRLIRRAGGLAEAMKLVESLAQQHVLSELTKRSVTIAGIRIPKLMTTEELGKAEEKRRKALLPWLIMTKSGIAVEWKARTPQKKRKADPVTVLDVPDDD